MGDISPNGTNYQHQTKCHKRRDIYWKSWQVIHGSSLTLKGGFYTTMIYTRGVKGVVSPLDR